MFKTNSKIPPLQQTNQTKNITLSIKSKQQPLLLSKQKISLSQPQTNNQPQIKYFPVQEYKNFLKGQRIYLEVYYKGKLITSGYEPYIEAMGGQVMKRISPTTTVILTTEMPREKYTKLRSRVDRICKHDTVILSILWLQEIYRQKKKVNKDAFLFDQQTDIIDLEHQKQEQQEPMPDYFQRQIFKQDEHNSWVKYFQNCQHDMIICIQDNKKLKDKNLLSQPGMVWIEPAKFILFDENNDNLFKEMKNKNDYKYFYPQIKQKKKNQNQNQRQTKQIKKPTIQTQKNRKSEIKQNQKMKIQQLNHKRTRSTNKKQLNAPQINQIIQMNDIEYDDNIQNFQQQKIQKGDNLKFADQQKSNQQKINSNMSPNGQKKYFTKDGKLTKLQNNQNKQKQKQDVSSNNDSGQQTQADFLKRIRQKKQQTQQANNMWKKLFDRQKPASLKLPNTKSQSNNCSKASKMSQRTPSKSQTLICDKTMTAIKGGQKRQ